MFRANNTYYQSKLIFLRLFYQISVGMGVVFLADMLYFTYLSDRFTYIFYLFLLLYIILTTILVFITHRINIRIDKKPIEKKIKNIAYACVAMSILFLILEIAGARNMASLLFPIFCSMAVMLIYANITKIDLLSLDSLAALWFIGCLIIMLTVKYYRSNMDLEYHVFLSMFINFMSAQEIYKQFAK